MNRFRTAFAALTTCILLTGSGCGQDLPGQDPSDTSVLEQQMRDSAARAETLRVNSAFIAAVNVPDLQQAIGAVLGVFTDDMQHIGIFGHVRGKDQLRAVLQVALSAPGRGAALISNDGWALDRNHLVSISHFDNWFTGPDGQTVTLRLRAIRAMVRQRDGSYRIVAEHTSVGAPLPPAPSSQSSQSVSRQAAPNLAGDAFTALMTSWQDNFNARNLDALMNGYTRDIRFVYAFEGEEGLGKDALRADLSGTFAATPDIAINLQQYEVVPLGDSAAMGLGYWEDTFTPPGGVPIVVNTHSSEIFVRDDDGWKTRFEGTSFVLPSP